MEKIIEVLWLSAQAPYKSAPDAGGKIFYKYYKALDTDEKFHVKTIAVAMNESIKAMAHEEEFNNIEEIILHDSSQSCFWKFVRIIDYFFNPFQKYGGHISLHLKKQIERCLVNLKESQYEPDTVILEWTGMLSLVDVVKELWPSCKCVVTEHDVTIVGYARKAKYYKGLKGIFWKIREKVNKEFEINSLKKCDVINLLNYENRFLLKEYGIDEEKCFWLVPTFYDLSNLIRKPVNHEIIFYGAMARLENEKSAIWFIENVMPLLEDTDIVFTIIGNKPSDRLLKYKSDKVKITGFVEEIAPFFISSLCMVAPLVLGAGIKIKVLEGLSSGIPVLTNSIGIEGINVENEREYFHCETPNEYATVIRRLLDGQIDTKYIEKNAKQYIVQNLSFDAAINEYKKRIN